MSLNLTLKSTVKLNSGYELPRLGFGVFEIPNNAEAQAACKAALDVGYRHIDTATYYRNERGVGDAVRACGLRRDEVFVTSKVHSFSKSYTTTLSAIQASLNASGLECLDLYLIHDPMSGREVRVEMWKALLEAQKRGWIKSAGVSNFNAKHLEDLERAGLPPPAVNQVELHPYCQQRPITTYCQAHGIVVQAYSPLVRGKFADRKDAISEIAEKKGVSVPQVLLRWSLQKGFVPLPKSTTPSRIASNADLYNFELSEDEMKRIDALDRGDKGAVTWNPTGSA